MFPLRSEHFSQTETLCPHLCLAVAAVDMAFPSTIHLASMQYVCLTIRTYFAPTITTTLTLRPERVCNIQFTYVCRYVNNYFIIYV